VDRITLTTRACLPRFHARVRLIRYKKSRNEAISHHAAATPECEAPLSKIQRKKPICNALAKAAGVRAQPRRPMAPGGAEQLGRASLF